MNQIRIAALAAMLVLVVAGTPLAAQEAGIDGRWNIIRGEYAETRYTGTVDFETFGEQYNVRWNVDGDTPVGVGLYEEGRLYVGWGAMESHGVVLYDIHPDGSLTGRWTLSMNDGALGTERATGGSLNKKSVYKVTGTNPGNGSAYEGKVTVWKVGDVYQFQWEIGGDTFAGAGLRIGNKLAVGWGRGEGQIGVATYLFNGDRADGTWAIPGKETIGIENLERPRRITPGK